MGKKVKTKKPFWKDELFENIIMIVIVVGVVLVIDRFVAMPTRVVGTSMYPTLQNGDFLVVNRLAYTWSEPERFDIVVFSEVENQTEEYLIKRIIGLPGETVFVSDSTVYVDGEPLEEYYWYEAEFDGKDMTEPVTLQEGEYFVMGDNRVVSMDSRSDEVGTVYREQFIGKAVFRFLPFDGIGLLGNQ